MKRIVWTIRREKDSAETIDGEMRERIPDLPKGPPKQGWHRNVAWGIEVGYEEFPGSRRVWLWEE